MARRSRWPSWILLGSVAVATPSERLMGDLRHLRSRVEPSARHPPDQHRHSLATPGRQIGPARRLLALLLLHHDALPPIEPTRVGPRCLHGVTLPTAYPL